MAQLGGGIGGNCPPPEIKIIMQLTDRFNEHMKISCKIQLLVPMYICNAEYEGLSEAVEFYKQDISKNEMKDEFVRWKAKWLRERNEGKDIPSNAVETLTAISTSQKIFYPNVYVLIKILATLPVTTASAERSFSCLRRLKSYLRSTMCEERLSGLAMMQIQRKKMPSADEVLDQLAKSKRKFDFVL